MTTRLFIPILFLALGLTGCTKTEGGAPSEDSSYGSKVVSDNSGDNGTDPGSENTPGVVTAGEWNDLDNWAFLENLLKKEEAKSTLAQWNFNLNRISVLVKGADLLPVNNVQVILKSGATVWFTARTDNFGKAELWPGLVTNAGQLDFSKFTIEVGNGETLITSVKPYHLGVNNVVLSPDIKSNKIEIAFVVDATGSMGDELEFLKTELLDVISKVKQNNPNADLLTSSVFYRDEGDEYVTRVSGFTNNINSTLDFIKKQSAGGGGDFPEAVHSALDKTINELQWSEQAKTRLAFLLLDAPPHNNSQVIGNLQNSVLKAATKGIKIIPITASGINKETEFLMRAIALATNGTYVFITNHSGIGNNHLEATVGEYQVEYLNNLMVRLINKYAQT